MVTAAIDTMGRMRAQLARRSRWDWWLHIGITFAAASKLAMILFRVRTHIPQTDDCFLSVRGHGMSPVPALSTLGDTWVCTCQTDEAFTGTKIERLADEGLSSRARFEVKNVKPDRGRV